MVWEIERHSRRSILIGAAHFFPRHFRRELRRWMADARVVLLEGPLDPVATKKVLDAGRGVGGLDLYKAAKDKINARLGIYSAPLDVNRVLETAEAEFDRHKVSPRLNSAKNDDESLIQAV